MDAESDTPSPPEVVAEQNPVKTLKVENLEHFSIFQLDDTTPNAPSRGSSSSSLATRDEETVSNKSRTPEPPGGGEEVPEAQSAMLESQANLKERCQELSNQLAEKDMTISTLQRTCSLLEKETALSKRELEISQREKESAVMRYAIVEKKVIDANLSRDASEKKLKEGQKEVDVLNHKIRQMNTEKTRMSQIVEQKCADIRHYQREVEKIKMDLSMWESTNKASTAKIKQEAELRTSAEQKITDLIAELDGYRSAEKAQIRNEVDSSRLQTLEKQTMEQQADLILYKHEAAEKDKRIAEIEGKLTQLTKELQENADKHSTMTADYSTFKEDNERLRNEIVDLQNTLDREVFKVADLQAKLNDLDSIRAQLRIERDSTMDLKAQLATLKSDLEESNTSLDKYRKRERELLDINKELTECTARLQNDLSLHMSKSLALELAKQGIEKEKLSFDDRLCALEKQLESERVGRSEEKERLERELSESSRMNETLEEKLNNSLGDAEALRSKHSQSLKELNRELMLAEKKISKLEQMRIAADSNSDCNSTKSDNVSDSESIQNGHSSREAALRANNDSSMPKVLVHEPSKQSLIDRIVRLQQANAKQTEKMDFLENHSATLVLELQKKAKLVHHYMMRDQAGALASIKSDKHKAELAKYGGIMSAIYSGVKGNSGSSEMTLDLSLEINKKLQAVLEDTLLKNITLKENLDTLGLEVDKLTRRLATK